MAHTHDILIEEYNYSLPDNNIALYPLKDRDSSRLLVYNDNKITEAVFRDISDYIPADSLMIVNNTSVINARMFFRKEDTGAKIEIFCLEPNNNGYDIATELNQKGKTTWNCLIRNPQKWKTEYLKKTISLGNREVIVSVKMISKNDDGSFAVEFDWQPSDICFGDILEQLGNTPLPPYIKREIKIEDKNNYQTIYAQHNGSVAAPTAGLHFTEQVFESLKKKNILTEKITLHVGAGTFKPVKSANIKEHLMHSEAIIVSKSLIEIIKQNIDTKPIISVGTTTMRSLESLYYAGVKLIKGYAEKSFIIKQWEVYELDNSVSVGQSMSALLAYLAQTNKENITIQSELIIVPGFQFHIASCLVTNFHLPQSTLLLLIAAFIGDGWKHAYEFALQNNFRFLSYGDCCLFYKDK